MEEAEEKKNGIKKQEWFGFLFFVGFALFSFYANVIWAGLLFAGFATFSFPNPAYQFWLKNKGNEALGAIKGLLYLGFILLLIVGFVWFIGKVFGGIGNIGKYEGQTAEEWFNDYDDAEARYQQLYDCVEPYATAGKYISADDLYYECF